MSNNSKNKDDLLKRLSNEISELENSIVSDKELSFQEVTNKYGPEEASSLYLSYTDELIKKFNIKRGRSPVHFFRLEGTELTCYSLLDDNRNEEIIGMTVIPDINFDFSEQYRLISKKNSVLTHLPLDIKIPYRDPLVLKIEVYLTTFLVEKEASGLGSISDFFTAKQIGLTDSIILSNYYLEKLSKKLGHDYEIKSYNRIGDKKTVELLFELLNKQK